MRCYDFVGAILISMVTIVSCSKPKQQVAPPAPTMPAGWSVTSDANIPAAQLPRIAETLGGNIVALRNTVYDVKGKRIQLNILVAADAANADAIMTSFKDIKPDEFLLRKDLIIYEFVGKDDAIPDMNAGKAHIQEL